MYLEYVDKSDAISILQDELYEELYAIDDPVDRAQEEIRILDRAKVLGVKAKAEKLLKAHKQSIVKQDNYISSFTGQTLELCTGQWRASDNGIWTWSDKGQVWASYQPIYPAKVLVNIETDTYKTVLRYKVRGRWIERTFDKSILASNNKILELAKYGLTVTSENSKALVKYLADVEALNEDIITEQTSTSRFGWVASDIDVFMPFGDEVVFDNESNLMTLFRSISHCGDRAKWYTLMKELRSSRKREILLYLASSLASVLVEPCGALPFIVNLWGETGKGKTVLLKLAASIWANPREGQYMADAKSTITAQEIRLDTLNNLPMLIDDMAQIRNQCDGDFSTLVYRWCSGQGKDRSNVGLGLNRLNHWKNCILTNAEHSLVTETMQGGAINRIIDVEMQDGYIFEDGNYVCEIIHDNYGYCGQEFIEVVQNIGFEKVREIQKAFVEQIKSEASKRSITKEEKQMIPMSIILTADKIATDYLYKDGIYLDFNDCFELMKDQGEVSEHKRAYQFLKDEIIKNWHKFEPIDDDLYRGEQWGKIRHDSDDHDVAIVIGTIFDEMLKKGGFQSKAFLSWARKNEVIEVGADGKTKKQAKIGCSNTRCIFMRMYMFDDEDAENGFVKALPEDLPFD